MSPALGLDFGTTNTVAAMADGGNGAQTIRFAGPGAPSPTYRSVISFWSEQGSGSLRTEGGPWAIDRFVDNPGDTRFLQSFKTFAASPLFDTTAIFGKRLRFPDILEAFFRTALRHGGSELARMPETLVLGRPVRFAGQNADAAIAKERYEVAFRRFGFERIVHVLEPVAAAYYFAQRLTASATVMVGDFGGGTSDFSIIRFHPGRDGFRVEPLSHSGVGLAGDRLDFRIIEAVVSPRLGKGSFYESWGKELAIPSHFYTTFARWNELCLFKYSAAFRDLKSLWKTSTDPEKLHNFISFIESDEIYSLYLAISSVKICLSEAEVADFVFNADGIEIAEPIRRSDFESWIADDLKRLESCVGDALRQANLGTADIDKVFLTGGTSFVPAVRAIFNRLFGEDRVEGGEELLAVASGLALIGQEANLDRWQAETEKLS